MEINIYQKAIEQLVLEGHIILQIKVPESDEYLFFNVYKWQEGYFNTAQSIDFNTVEGVNITDFLKKNSANYTNRTNFISLFQKEMEDGILVHCEFTKSATWFKWQAPDGTKKF